MMTMAVFQVVSSTLIGKLFNKYKVERYHIIMTGIIFMVV
jgi:MFS family permease